MRICHNMRWPAISAGAGQGGHARSARNPEGIAGRPLRGQRRAAAAQRQARPGQRCLGPRAAPARGRPARRSAFRGAWRALLRMILVGLPAWMAQYHALPRMCSKSALGPGKSGFCTTQGRPFHAHQATMFRVFNQGFMHALPDRRGTPWRRSSPCCQPPGRMLRRCATPGLV